MLSGSVESFTEEEVGSDDELPDVLGSSPVFLQDANIVRTRSAARASDSFFMILSPLSFAIFFPFNVTGNITEFIISKY